MKTNIVIPGLTRNLLLLGLLSLCACTQTLTREEPRELSLRAVAAAATKANPELTGTALPTTGANAYEIHTSISADGATYASNQLFAYESSDTKWYASPDPIYWPMSGTSVDFLALAYPSAAALAPTWNTTSAAADVTLSNWDVSADQLDVLYATANGQTSTSNAGTVSLNFQHALALICFNVKSGSPTGIYTIKEMTVKNLDYKGTLMIDNTKTEVATTWSDLAHSDKTLLSGASIAVPGTNDIQLSDHLLVIPQAARTITLTYRADNSATDLTLTLPLPRVNWKAGHKYTYNLTFSATEITASVTVANWDGTAEVDITIS
ncbi:MAG: fimbrillin family protein [Bacteroidales bacterium]|nr:fimbrillin family protein [Bacteroidales bacterium]